MAGTTTTEAIREGHQYETPAQGAHTPGPWVPVFTQFDALVRGPIGYFVCDIEGRSQRSDADACLIAAAPDMLAALKAMVLNDTHTYRDCHKAAIAAIAKAEGR